MKKLPSNSIDLIQELDRQYPHRCIAADETPEAAHRRAGARELVDTLLALVKRDERRAADQLTQKVL